MGVGVGVGVGVGIGEGAGVGDDILVPLMTPSQSQEPYLHWPVKAVQPLESVNTKSPASMGGL